MAEQQLKTEAAVSLLVGAAGLRGEEACTIQFMGEPTSSIEVIHVGFEGERPAELPERCGELVARVLLAEDGSLEIDPDPPDTGGTSPNA